MHAHAYNRPRNITCLLFAAFLTLLTTLSFLIIEFSPASVKHTICASVFPDTSLTRASYEPDPNAPRARDADPRSLIAAVAQGQRLSARFIHQSWKTHDVLPHVAALADSWKLAYPEWNYVLWDDADNKELVRILYPKLLPAYEALPREIYRADFVRNLYMHAFGGIYADLDSEAIASLEPMLSAAAERASSDGSVPVAFVGEMSAPIDPAHGIPNAFFAATQPGHPFWFVPVEFAVAWTVNWTMRKTEGEIPVDPEFVTGPAALRYSVFLYAAPEVLPIPDEPELHLTKITKYAPLPAFSLLPSPIAPNATAPPVSLLPPDIIYPYSWNTPRPHVASAATKCVCGMHLRTYDRTRCKARVGAHWVINYWGHGW